MQTVLLRLSMKLTNDTEKKEHLFGQLHCVLCAGFVKYVFSRFQRLHRHNQDVSCCHRNLPDFANSNFKLPAWQHCQL